MTPKQAAFIQAYIDTQNASEAYRLAYNSNAAANIIHRKAYDLLQHPAIKKELEVLQEQAKERNKVTIDSILQELEQARTLALEADNPQCSAAIAASMSKAKLLGLVVEKQEIKSNACSSINVSFKTVKDLTDAELEAECKKYGIA